MPKHKDVYNVVLTSKRRGLLRQRSETSIGY